MSELSEQIIEAMARVIVILGERLGVDEIPDIPTAFDRVTAERDAALAENKLLRHDVASYLETVAKVCDMLGVDLESAKSAEGKPSDVLFSYIGSMQQRLTAADEELDQCQSMALMIEEKEWAEHVGKGPISSRVESAFTQLHNELSEARQAMTAADERVDVLERALSKIKLRCDAYLEAEMGMPYDSVEVCQSIAGVALKPAEGLDRRDMAAKVHLMKREAQVKTSCEWCAGCGHDPYGEKCGHCQP